jgi:hypothetical protein
MVPESVQKRPRALVDPRDRAGDARGDDPIQRIHRRDSGALGPAALRAAEDAGGRGPRRALGPGGAPRSIDYEPTEKGRALGAAIEALSEWAEIWVSDDELEPRR